MRGRGEVAQQQLRGRGEVAQQQLAAHGGTLPASLPPRRGPLVDCKWDFRGAKKLREYTENG